MKSAALDDLQSEGEHTLGRHDDFTLVLEAVFFLVEGGGPAGTWPRGQRLGLAGKGTKEAISLQESKSCLGGSGRPSIILRTCEEEKERLSGPIWGIRSVT